MFDPVVSITVKIRDGDGGLIKADGRVAWALNELIAAGRSGISSKSYPGVRVADSIMKLRRDCGLNVSTEHLGRGGPFPGRFGVYRLEHEVDVVQVVRASERDAAKVGGAA